MEIFFFGRYLFPAIVGKHKEIEWFKIRSWIFNKRTKISQTSNCLHRRRKQTQSNGYTWLQIFRDRLHQPRDNSFAWICKTKKIFVNFSSFILVFKQKMTLLKHTHVGCLFVFNVFWQIFRTIFHLAKI